MYWMSGIPPQVIAAARRQADAGAYRLRSGNWQGHRLADVPVEDLRRMLRMPAAAVPDEVKGYITLVLGLPGADT